MLTQLVTHLMKKKVSTEKAPLFIVWNRNSFSTTLRYSMLSVITSFVISIVHLSVRNFGTSVNETICVLLQSWQITQRYEICCVLLPLRTAATTFKLLWKCCIIACVWMWFQSLFLITWANFASYLKYYSFLIVLSIMYYDNDQEINLILGNELTLWQVSALNGPCDRCQH